MKIWITLTNVIVMLDINNWNMREWHPINLELVLIIFHTSCAWLQFTWCDKMTRLIVYSHFSQRAPFSWTTLWLNKKRGLLAVTLLPSSDSYIVIAQVQESIHNTFDITLSDLSHFCHYETCSHKVRDKLLNFINFQVITKGCSLYLGSKTQYFFQSAISPFSILATDHSFCENRSHIALKALRETTDAA